MRSLLATALALGVTVNGQYYIGNYSVNGVVSTIIPYPLEVCAPNGALSSYNYVIYSCVNGNITEQVYTDAECEGTVTATNKMKVVNKPGYAGYSDCLEAESASYVQVGQYLTNCANWNEGKDPAAYTLISTDSACVYAKTQGGVPIFSETFCAGDSYTTYLYADDPSCSSTAIKTLVVPLGCYFYETMDGLNIYNAWMECFDGLEDVYERCTSAEAVATYEANLVIYNYTLDEIEQLFEDLFWYSTIDTEVEWSGADETTANVTLELEFCTQWEFEKYESWIESIGTTIQSAIGVSDEINVGVNKICWMCLDFTYAKNATVYGGFTCDKSQQCWMSTTTTMMTTKKSASTVYVSMISLIGLLLFSLF